MDNLMLQAMAVEADLKLAGSRLDRVIQPTRGAICFQFWTGTEKLCLHVQTEDHPVFYLSNQKTAAPAKPPRFCQLLRARLKALISVKAECLDRIVHLKFTGGKDLVYDLVFEAFGNRGNLVLINAADQIVDLMWRHDGKRCLMPGTTYTLPENCTSISLLSKDPKLSEMVVHNVKGNLSNPGERNVYLLSPALSQAICSEMQTGKLIDDIICHIQLIFQKGKFDAWRVEWDDHYGLLPFLIGRDGFTSVKHFKDLSALLEFERALKAQTLSKNLHAHFQGLINRQIKKLIKRLEKIIDQMDHQPDPETFRIKGELLLANIHEVIQGSHYIKVLNYYQDPSIMTKIQLDPRLSPQKNAEEFFKLYRKAKRAKPHLRRRHDETIAELKWLEDLLLALEEADSTEDLYHIQLELETCGLLKKSIAVLGKRPARDPKEMLRHAVTSHGLRLFWGKNSRTNDYVSRILTTSKDLWFHAHRLPGCHLVLKAEDSSREVTEEDILCAAAYAA
ncbi:MAG: NFACT family protein, partial [Deltaproteobacteria bacterium]|nr:NFACT family protein [Deltaproteobacteria bacterium]